MVFLLLRLCLEQKFKKGRRKDKIETADKKIRGKNTRPQFRKLCNTKPKCVTNV